MRITADRSQEVFTPAAQQAEGDFTAWLSSSEGLTPVISFQGAGLFRAQAAAGKAAPATVSWASLALGGTAGFQGRQQIEQAAVSAPGQVAPRTSGDAGDRDPATLRESVAPAAVDRHGSPLATIVSPLAQGPSRAAGPGQQAGRPAADRSPRPVPSEAPAPAFSIHVEDGAVQVIARLGTVCVAERRQLRSRVEGIVSTLGYSLGGLTIDGFNLPPAGGSTEGRHGDRRD